MEISSTEALVFSLFVFLPAGVASTVYRNLSGARAARDQEHRMIGLLTWAAVCAVWVLPFWGTLHQTIADAQAGAVSGRGVFALVVALVVVPYAMGLLLGKSAEHLRGRRAMRAIGLLSWREHSVWEDLLLGPKAIWMQFRDGRGHYQGRVRVVGSNTVLVGAIRCLDRDDVNGLSEPDFEPFDCETHEQAIIHEDGRVSWFHVDPEAGPESRALTWWCLALFWFTSLVFLAMTLNPWWALASALGLGLQGGILLERVRANPPK
jgi:hypothetical protein